MRIALTGASSQIGQVVRNLFCKDGHSVVSLVRRPKTSDEIFFDLSHSLPPDLLESTDVLVHIGWDRSRDYKESLDINRIGGLQLIDKCAELGVRPVLLSTVSVHAKLSEYGFTKRLIENHVLNMSGKVVRSGLIWGGDPSGFLKVIEQLANIPLFRPQMTPDPIIFHSEVNTLAKCIVHVSLTTTSPNLISAVSGDCVKLSELMSAIAGGRGLRVKVPSRTAYQCLRNLEKIGVKLPFGSDSINGLLEGVVRDEVFRSRFDDFEFPASSDFLLWASNRR